MQVQLIVGYRLKWESVYHLGEDAGLGYLKLVELFRESLEANGISPRGLFPIQISELCCSCVLSKYLADLLHSRPHS